MCQAYSLSTPGFKIVYWDFLGVKFAIVKYLTILSEQYQMLPMNKNIQISKHRNVTSTVK